MLNNPNLLPTGAPDGSQCFIKGQYLKIGRLSKVFAYRNGEWVFTNGITVQQITRELIAMDLKGKGIT